MGNIISLPLQLRFEKQEVMKPNDGCGDFYGNYIFKSRAVYGFGFDPTKIIVSFGPASLPCVSDNVGGSPNANSIPAEFRAVAITCVVAEYCGPTIRTPTT